MGIAGTSGMTPFVPGPAWKLSMSVVCCRFILKASEASARADDFGSPSSVLDVAETRQTGRGLSDGHVPNNVWSQGAVFGEPPAIHRPQKGYAKRGSKNMLPLSDLQVT